eukprot:TRINITY_DN6488_c0_g1_i12.p1 TRINITY_DN6488_c0_g1~~TRINITY_DN6488_c0_g1_i12.p1  ORF type:complete len:256 (+),score=18.98 TRINITY_DN6488_c0_g1_i12:57-770(+)
MPSWPLRSVALLGLARYLHAAPVKLIIDTDIGGGGCRDVDDIGALAVAHALADSGEVDLLAVVLNTNPQPCAGVISVLNTYYNRQHLPIGAYKGPGLDPNSPFWPYVTDLVENFPSAIKNASQVPDAVEVYRRMLASQPDRSVTISSIGILTNLAALLRSGPDDISPLSGRELMARKVKLVAAMAGMYPRSVVHAECNMCGCALADAESAATASAASAFVFENTLGCERQEARTQLL